MDDTTGGAPEKSSIFHRKTENMEKPAFDEKSLEEFKDVFNEEEPATLEDALVLISHQESQIEGLKEVIRHKDSELLRVKVDYNKAKINLHSERVNALRKEMQDLGIRSYDSD